MRLWSLNPLYLDYKGLGGVWREGLLAQAVLLGKTKGWKNHPQLSRFQNSKEPSRTIGFYLLKIYEEAQKRGYTYNKSKIVYTSGKGDLIQITNGQLLYEFSLLKERLKTRARAKYKKLLVFERKEEFPTPHPLFYVVAGNVESWETSYWKNK